MKKVVFTWTFWLQISKFELLSSRCKKSDNFHPSDLNEDPEETSESIVSSWNIGGNMETLAEETTVLQSILLFG